MAELDESQPLPNGVKAWVESFLVHRPALFRLLGGMVRQDEIEDIVQETFIQSYTANRHQRIDNPRAFMLRVARNIALNHVKRADRRLNCSLDDLHEFDPALRSDAVEAQCLADETFLIFCRAVAELPVGCRRVFILKKVYGMSQREIADYLGISSSTVEKHVAKGMYMVAQHMASWGLVAEVGLSGIFRSEEAKALE